MGSYALVTQNMNII